VVGDGGVVDESCGIGSVDEQLRYIEARVFGPTAPKPVVLGLPLETISWVTWYVWTAASVRLPKYPVSFPAARKR
jgi:hypothetical protein